MIEKNMKTIKENYTSEKNIKELEPRSRGIDFLESLEKVKNKTNELIQMQMDLEELYSDLDFHREEIHNMTKKWLETQAELEEKNYAFKSLQNQLKKLYRKSELHEKEINNLRKKLQKNEDEKDKPEIQLYKTKDKPLSKDKEVEKTKSEIISQQSELQQKLQEIDTIQADLEKKQEKLNAILQNSETRHEENSMLYKQLEEINEEMTSGEQTLNLFKSELNEIKTQLISNPVQPLKTDEFIGFLQEELRQKQKEIKIRDEIIKKIRENKTPLDANQKHDNFEEKYYDLKDQFDQLDEEHIKLRRAAEKLINEYGL